MIKEDLLQLLYGGLTTAAEFCYDNLTAPPLNQILWHPNDIGDLNSIVNSIRLAGDINKKYEYIDAIMNRRNMKRFAAGTNRLVYRHMEIPSIILKCAVDEEGVKNSPDEFWNQQFIKPFCTKVFETSPDGVVGVFERVERITSRFEFASIADDVYDLITHVLIGKYVMEDIGTNFMYNYGIRTGFGPVILDFPYLYELDGGKIYCEQLLDDGTICNGEIDYDDGFNFLTCTKCGKLHRASDLSKPRKQSGLFVKSNKRGAIKDMKIEICRGNTVIKTKEYADTTEFMTLKKETKWPKRAITDASEIRKVPTVVGVYGRKTHKEALNEYYKKNPEVTTAYEDKKYGVFVRCYGDTEESTETQMQKKINSAVSSHSIVTELPKGLVIETVRVACNDNANDEKSDPVDDTVVADPAIKEVEAAVEESVATNDNEPEETVAETVSDDSDKESVADNENTVAESTTDESESKTESDSSSEDQPLTMAITFGDESENDKQEITEPKTESVMRRPTPSKARSRRYDSSFYETRTPDTRGSDKDK